MFSFIQHKRKTQKHEKVCKGHDYCYVEMPDEGNKILKFNHREKSMRVPFIINADINVYLKKCTRVKIIFKNLTQKKN